jgi:hypothetical protein
MWLSHYTPPTGKAVAGQPSQGREIFLAHPLSSFYISYQLITFLSLQNGRQTK